ncbi:sensor histidine kinase [Streptomyces lavendofoliae]|uniref:histidine kinase n=1 Tax=Streptomyces lavendofoliae TaxID=67314 RepID=A0A918HY48_9ACTN|nr:sensor histidine kinase [Streptomyces lavendofoliae]GGU37767.1 two-component sensor histidine kinase [Streptomyces lavendofoliae]
MTEAAAEPGTAQPVRHRDRGRRTASAVRPPGYADPASVRAARLVRAARRRASRLPPTVRDALLPALLLLHITTTRAPHELPVAVALTAALALPLVWRRRAPLTVFGAVAAAAFVQWLVNVPLPADIALPAALYTAAANSGRRGTLVAGAVVEGGALLACLRWATEGAFLASFVAVTALVVSAAVLGVNVRTTRAYLAASEERAARLEQQQEQQARLAVAEERTRIAREMHDIVTHNLSVMVALTDAAVYAQHRSPDKATAVMLQISETGRQALTDMRRSLGVLRTDEPDAERHPLPGIAQLESLADQMRAAGLPTRVRVEGGHTHIPATAQLTVYRLVQEALTNTLKHTPTGTHAKVRVRCSAEAVTVDVTDSGPCPPLPVAAPSGHGIPGMRERSAAYGGTLRAGPLPGGGWGVHTRLDLGGGATSA